MNGLKSFENIEFGEIRTLEVDGKPYFVASDVARALGYSNPSKATNDHCKNAVMRWGNDSLGRPQEFKIVPEGDLYRLIAHSKLPSAEKFESWVFDEVLPSVRKHGGYIAGQERMSDDELLEKAVLVAQRKIAEREKVIEQQREQIEQDRPKVIFADAVAASRSSILIGELAKILRQNGIDTGEKRLFHWMRQQGYLIRRSGTDYNMPTQRGMELRLFEIRERTINNPDGSIRITKTVMVTGVGQRYFINKFLGRQESKEFTGAENQC